MNAKIAARRAKGRKPEVTQASSVLSHWITEYIHVFCPYGPAVGCSNLLLADLVRLKHAGMTVFKRLNKSKSDLFHVDFVPRYFRHPAFRPSDQSSTVQNRSVRFCRRHDELIPDSNVPPQE